MTEREIILAEIERLKSCKLNLEEDTEYLRGYDFVVDTIKEFINSLPAEQPSEDLKKAAEEYASMSQIAYKGIHCTYVDDQHAFIAGADWQKEQMMKNAIVGEVQCALGDGHDLSVKAMLPKDANFLYLQKVKVVIMEDEQ